MSKDWDDHQGPWVGDAPARGDEPPCDDYDVHDELAELYIGTPTRAPASGGGRLSGVDRAPQDAAGDHPSAPRGPSVELVLTAHLPSLAGAWQREYASRSAEAGPVLVARPSLGWLLELFCRERTGVAGQPLHAEGQLLRHAERVGARWVAIAVAEELEPVLASGVCDTLTVLTGADQAATVAAYESIKSAHAALRRGNAAAPELRVAFAGVSEAEASRSANRLREACARFLGLELRAWSTIRMGATRPVPPACRMESGLDLADLLDAAGATRVDTRPRPSDIVPPRGSEPERPAGGWARLIDGLRPLDIPCPVVPGVEFAVDEHSRLHIVAWHEPDGAARLRAARRWAWEHAPLLERLVPGLSAHPLSGDATPHLLAGSAGEAVRASADGIRAHAAREIEINGARVWVAIPVD